MGINIKYHGILSLKSRIQSCKFLCKTNVNVSGCESTIWWTITVPFTAIETRMNSSDTDSRIQTLLHVSKRFTMVMLGKCHLQKKTNYRRTTDHFILKWHPMLKSSHYGVICVLKPSESPSYRYLLWSNLKVQALDFFHHQICWIKGQFRLYMFIYS